MFVQFINYKHFLLYSSNSKVKENDAQKSVKVMSTASSKPTIVSVASLECRTNKQVTKIPPPRPPRSKSRSSEVKVKVPVKDEVRLQRYKQKDAASLNTRGSSSIGGFIHIEFMTRLEWPSISRNLELVPDYMICAKIF